MSRRSNLTAAVYLLLVFLSGALVGVFAYRLYMVNSVISGTRRSPDEYRRRYIEELGSRLDLSANQVQQLQQIMDETRQRYREIHERYKPEMKVIETAQYERIRAMLTETQRAEYEKMRAERERRRTQQGGSRKPGK